jgi:hypothetical protein
MMPTQSTELARAIRRWRRLSSDVRAEFIAFVGENYFYFGSLTDAQRAAAALLRACGRVPKTKSKRRKKTSGGHGYGHGCYSDGSGRGDGIGWGNGEGSGSGYGHGYGDGDGFDSGPDFGSGYGLPDDGYGYGSVSGSRRWL